MEDRVPEGSEPFRKVCRFYGVAPGLGSEEKYVNLLWAWGSWRSGFPQFLVGIDSTVWGVS